MTQCACGCGEELLRTHWNGKPVRFLRCHYAKTQPKTPLLERFWRHVKAGSDDECWPWEKCPKDRYGAIGKDGVIERAHRVSWQIHIGPIPPGVQVLHTCDNPPCVNPKHLFLGDQTANMRDMARKGRGRSAPRAALQNSKAKVTRAEVAEIRQQLGAGHSQSTIARRFNISQTNVSAISRRKTWGEIPGPAGRHNCVNHGEKNGRAKLTEPQIREIRLKASSIKEQARHFGVSAVLITKIRSRKIWKHVE